MPAPADTGRWEALQRSPTFMQWALLGSCIHLGTTVATLGWWITTQWWWWVPHPFLVLAIIAPGPLTLVGLVAWVAACVGTGWYWRLVGERLSERLRAGGFGLERNVQAVNWIYRFTTRRNGRLSLASRGIAKTRVSLFVDVAETSYRFGSS